MIQKREEVMCTRLIQKLKIILSILLILITGGGFPPGSGI